MTGTFLNKSKKIVLENIGNEKFGVSELAAELGLSRSQVLRKIKSSTGVSANQFIRDYRLEAAIQYLKQDAYTASEIAYKVGFSSPSYFNKCFHDKYGFTPGDFKKQKDTDDLDSPSSKKQIVKNRKTGIIAILVFVVLLVAVVIKFVDVPIENELDQDEQYASIAVLPLLDLSENKNREYLALGLTDAITLELSKLKGLRVTSRGSSMFFQDSVTLYSEIANRLGVDLLLEGSLIYGSDSLRLTVQLIEPFPKEKHLWANKYDKSFADILQLADEISVQIRDEIALAVIPEKEFRVKEITKVDSEAYDLYLRGTQLLHKHNNPEAVKKATVYLKESIKIDSGYAPAYSALVETYIATNKFIRNNEEKYNNRKESRKAIDNALDAAIELDGSLAEAYITKGKILRKFDWDWKGMKEMAEKGLQLNPGNADGYLLLSDYYLIHGNPAKSVQQALLAESIDPLNPWVGCMVADKYMHAGKYQKSIAKFEQVLELFPRYAFAWDGIGYAQYMMGEEEKAKDSFTELMKILGNEEMAEYYQKENFFNSVSEWLIGATSGSKLYCSNPTIIAMAHLMTDQKEGALEYLEFAFEYRNEDLPVIMLRPTFKILYNEPRFQTIAKQLGVSLKE